MGAFYKEQFIKKAEKNEITQAINEVVRSANFILGEQVCAFEKEFASYCGTKYCIGVGNGSDALYLAIRCLALDEGSEILMAENSFIAAALAVIHNNCIPIPVPINENTFNLDPSQLIPFITPKTKAILVTHMYGQMAEMDSLMVIANLHGLVVIEDCAHAHGANLHGKYAGSFGLVSAYSFYPTKNLGAFGDGGAIVTNNSKLAEKLFQLRVYGINEHGFCNKTGINSRLDEMQAAILRIKLKYLEERNLIRKNIVKGYYKGIKNSNCILPTESENHVYHLFVIKSQHRDKLKNHLLLEGIETKIHYPKPYFLQVPGLIIPKQISKVYNQVLSLPVYPGLSAKNQKEIIKKINAFNG